MTSSIRFTVLSVLATLLIPITASADMFTPSHSCRKPYKPYEFQSKYEVETFNNDVKRYKECISDFVEEQDEASKKHLEAGQDAIEDWNKYVKYELN
ncbi:hypothetical protein [Methylotenera sp. L2L1]|uniref:hypothetical protein n=1 Tax=Methylotenera sp. L2L1 TaxID=1502770 RepID=UPI00055B56FC|nr:hypothetical protein [Methylotenera sp. L2L1]